MARWITQFPSQFPKGSDHGHNTKALPVIWQPNGVYQLTPAVSLAGMYTYTKGSGAHWHQGALQADYQLSKRTDTYVETLYQRASSGAPATSPTPMGCRADTASG